jgi:hypothetical protein
MREAYLDRRLTLRQMADEAECSLRTIARWMDNHGIPTDRSRIGNRTRGANAHQWKGGPQPCPSCGGPKTFYAKSCARCQDKTGANNPKWRSDDAVTYDAMHQRVVAARGRPGAYACDHCSAPAEEWAYDHTDPDERRSPSGRDDGPFSLDTARYMPLCVPCHRRFDNGLAKSRRR